MEEYWLNSKAVGLILEHLSESIQLGLCLAAAVSANGLWVAVRDFCRGRDSLSRAVVEKNSGPTCSSGMGSLVLPMLQVIVCC